MEKVQKISLLTNKELQNIQGGSITLATVVIGGKAIKVTAGGLLAAGSAAAGTGTLIGKAAGYFTN